MKPTMQAKTTSHVRLDCEVCAESSIIDIPAQRAPYGIVDCPRCGSTYLVSLDAPVTRRHSL